MMSTRKIALILSVATYVIVCRVDLVLAEPQDAHHYNKPTESKKLKTSDSGFLVEPTPLWVLPAPKDSDEKVARASMHYALIDEQNQVDSRGLTAYYHIVRVANDAEGLSSAAEIKIEFDPSYEALVFHQVQIWRNGVRLNKFSPNKVRLLRREPNLELQTYDGVVTATLVLDDVRIGDQVDLSYSVRGINPVFEGKYVRTVWMAGAKGSVKSARFRLLTPEDRKINHKAGASTTIIETTHDGMRDTEFLRVSVPQLHWDSYTPASAFRDDLVELSEFDDWAAVESWGQRMFASALATPSAQVVKTVEAIGATVSDSPMQKLQRVLDFVQKDVRYFGTEVGENTHRPLPPEDVIRHRFGDCKDKASLLISLLNVLGIKASPVLVSTRFKSDIDAAFPSPLVFNHVITRVELDDKVFWLDGTRGAQLGALHQRQSVGLGKGLILRSNSFTLIDLPNADKEERIAVEEFIEAKNMSEAPTLELKMVYFGEMAEFLRSALASQPIDTIEAKLNSEFMKFHPDAQRKTALLIEEIPEQNAIRTAQMFSLPKFWSFPEQKRLVGGYALWSFIEPLRHPEESSRKQAFQISYPGIYRHNVSIEFSEDMAKSESHQQLHNEDRHLSFQTDIDIARRKFQVSSELHITGDNVAPSEWTAYSELLRGFVPKLEGSFIVPAIPDTRATKLRSEVLELTESWKNIFSKGKPTTDVQSTAKIRRLVLTAELEGGRLSPVLKAQVLHQRGVQLDSLGLPDMAAIDFDEALRLAPNDAAILADAAVNCFVLGRDEQALEYARKALELMPFEDSPHRTIAYALYFGNNYAVAKQSLITLLKKRSEEGVGYTAIWLYLTSRRNDEDALAVVKPYLADSMNSWPHPVLHFLMGTKTFEQALEAAKEDQKDPSRLCELYFYAGEKYLMDGQVNQARALFKKSIDTDVVEYNEYMMSKRRLHLLGES